MCVRFADCSFTSPKRFKLKEHCRTHTHEKCFGCPNCGGLFSNKTKFTDHLRRQNTMESKILYVSHFLHFLQNLHKSHYASCLYHYHYFIFYFYMSGESYQCSHCLKYCASERILRDHMRHHSKDVTINNTCYFTCRSQWLSIIFRTQVLFIF